MFLVEVENKGGSILYGPFADMQAALEWIDKELDDEVYVIIPFVVVKPRLN
jgi:hypothetical protein